ncbi:MAG: zinc ribbon domain-containing protein, partial [Thermoplasmata archaeon]
PIKEPEEVEAPLVEPEISEKIVLPIKEPKEVEVPLEEPRISEEVKVPHVEPDISEKEIEEELAREEIGEPRFPEIDDELDKIIKEVQGTISLQEVITEDIQLECPECGTMISEDAVKCPGCGVTFETLEDVGESEELAPEKKTQGEMTFECPECGAYVLSNATKCPICGVVFETE